MTHYLNNHTEPKNVPPKVNEDGAPIQEKHAKEQTGSTVSLQENRQALKPAWDAKIKKLRHPR